MPPYTPMRLFIAIPLPPPIQEQILTLYQGLPHVHWIPAEKLHLTLKFLGETDPEKLDLIKSALTSIQHDSFLVRLKGVGCFYNKSFVRVIWVDFDHSPPLLDLQQKIDSVLQTHCLIAKETRPFVPHLTLTRPKGLKRSEVQDWLKQHEGFVTEPFDVTEFCLMESHTHPSSAVYQIVDKFNLQ